MPTQPAPASASGPAAAATAAAFREYPPPLTDKQHAKLAAHAIDWALAHGLVLRQATAAANGDVVAAAHAVEHAPFSLFPSPFPRVEYEKALAIMQILNSLFYKIASDDKFICSVMDKLSKVDEFTGRIYRIYRTVREEGVPQKATLGVFRSDYLLHAGTSATNTSPSVPNIQQVEFNTIASSFSALSHLVSQLHAFLAARTNFFNSSDLPTPDITQRDLPQNPSMHAIPAGIAQAHKLYNRPNAVVCMVVQPNERNAFDQRWIEYTLFNEHNVRLIRRTLAQIQEHGRLGPNMELFIDKDEISVTYFRAGYAPTDYPSETEWSARLLVERSLSIKCPSAAVHLAGTKKIQQVLALPGVLERFISDKVDAERVRSTFAGLYELGPTAEGQKSRGMALDRNGVGLVMKPQREGGGNNYYNTSIPPLLSKLSSEEQAAYILMDLIVPPPFKNVLVRKGVPVTASVVSELGIYGVLLVNDKGEEVVNQHAGHLLRTKTTETDEGGVAAGFAVIDSPFLV